MIEIGAGSATRPETAGRRGLIMQLRYIDYDGKNVALHLAGGQVTIGRSTEADIVVSDDQASRQHAAIRPWDEDYVIRDLGSRNGTFVNGQKVDVAVLSPGDMIRVGEKEIVFEEKGPREPETVIRELEEDLAEGKGYNTIMLDILRKTDKSEDP